MQSGFYISVLSICHTRICMADAPAQKANLRVDCERTRTDSKAYETPSGWDYYRQTRLSLAASV